MNIYVNIYVDFLDHPLAPSHHRGNLLFIDLASPFEVPYVAPVNNGGLVVSPGVKHLDVALIWPKCQHYINIMSRILDHPLAPSHRQENFLFIDLASPFEVLSIAPVNNGVLVCSPCVKHLYVA